MRGSPRGTDREIRNAPHHPWPRGPFCGLPSFNASPSGTDPLVSLLYSWVPVRSWNRRFVLLNRCAVRSSRALPPMITLRPPEPYSVSLPWFCGLVDEIDRMSPVVCSFSTLASPNTVVPLGLQYGVLETVPDGRQ